MIFEVKLFSQPEKYFKKVSVSVAKRLEKCFIELSENPFIINRNVKKIKGFDNLFRFREGNLRIIYSVDNINKIVLMQTILPRGDVYKKL